MVLKYECSDIVYILRLHLSALLTFLDKYISFGKICEDHPSVSEVIASRAGLFQHKPIFFSGLSYAPFDRDAVDVFKKQVRECPDQKFVKAFGEESILPNPFSSERGRKLSPAAQRAVDWSVDMKIP